MTFGATCPFVPVFTRVNREPLGVMVEVRIVPGNRAMAAFAILRETCGSVVRVRCSVVFLFVAEEAVRRCVEVTRRMAKAAIEADMGSG